eukprot:TRINITY_DN3021_c4_g1_i2.p1 TRINITY_DN3021_c4_g1~~TRINITY_DN3021_c4_g1_i2.p1  ORF type:complete len:680 (+),score=221.43 TRINITY_DN3021_c4_g1_i2:98-2137(+)
MLFLVATLLTSAVSTTVVLLEGTQGVLEYPRKGVSRPINDRKEWLVDCPSLVLFEWDKFELDGGHDFLMLRHAEGTYEVTGGTKGTLQGPVSLVFSSDRESRSGFKIRWSCIPVPSKSPPRNSSTSSSSSSSPATVLSGRNGELDYPGSGAVYKNNARAEWEIGCTERVYLSWKRFDMEDKFDTLRIKHGRGETYEVTGRSQASVLQGPLVLAFTSDYAVQKTGFSFRWSCGEEIVPPAVGEGATGWIKYPEQGEVYPNNDHREWHVNCRDSVELAWETFDVEDGYDFLRIHHRHGTYETPRWWWDLDTVFQGPLKFVFVSDSDIAMEGFSVRWTCGKGDKEDKNKNKSEGGAEAETEKQIRQDAEEKELAKKRAVEAVVHRDHLGCFKAEPMFLTEQAGKGTAETPAECVSTCTDMEYDYAGLLEGKECWCGHGTEKSVKTATAECDMQCSGDSGERCGGRSRLSLYSLQGTVEEEEEKKKQEATPLLRVGCFKEKETAKVLNRLAYSSGSNTAEECVSACLWNGFQYAGVEAGEECWCGDGVAGAERTATTECDLPCPGDESQWCGDGHRSLVFATDKSKAAPTTAPAVKFEGCHAYSELPVLAYRSRKGNTVEECTATCFHNGYTYAGLQYRSECWCGNSLSSNTKVADNMCRMPCSGDSSQSCGGAHRDSVYSKA